MDPLETKAVEIVVNGERKSAPAGLEVAGLLAWLAIDASRVAVELNGKIVRKPDWSTTPVGDGAAIEIVWFVGGG